MKILVTGGAGYVGTTLLNLLLERGYNVRVIDNLMYGGEQLLPFLRNSNFDFIKGDICNLDDVKKAVNDADLIIHLAAIVGFPACRKNPKLAEDVNVNGTKNIIKATSRDQLIIYSSTGSVYGTLEEICTEESRLNPLSLYGKSKTIAEQLLLDRGNVIVYRFATAFGISPRLRLDLLINDFTYRAVTEGYLVVYEKHFMRSFIHVYDMAKAFLFGIEKQTKMNGEIYNIGSKEMNYSKIDICNMLKEHTNVYVHYAEVGEDFDKRNYSVSYDKINSLGYFKTIDVNTGISELIKAFSVISFSNKYTNI